MPTVATKPNLVLDYHPRRYDIFEDRTCPVCQDTFCPERHTFNMAIKDGPIVCDDCAKKHSPPGVWDATEDFLGALDRLDTAFCLAPNLYRPGLFISAASALSWLVKHYERLAEH